MMSVDPIITIDEQPTPFQPGQTILEAALSAGIYIPHLCHHPEFAPHGSCKLCSVVVNGRSASACAMKAAPGQEIEVDTPELHAYRRTLVQMLFVEGNHFCPGCEKSGNCQLQALGYEFEMMTPHFVHFFPNPASTLRTPTSLIDLSRCIQCELCVRASRDVDGKGVFALAGRGLECASHRQFALAANWATPTSRLSDKAAHVCPVGAILIKRVGFAQPIGERLYDVSRSAPKPGAAPSRRPDAAIPAQPTPPRKIHIATTSLAGCFGCHMSLLDIDERLLELDRASPSSTARRSPTSSIAAHATSALIEGGRCATPRTCTCCANFAPTAKILVAVGACAINGGLPAQRNHLDVGDPAREGLRRAAAADRAIPNDPELPLLLDKVYPDQRNRARRLFHSRLSALGRRVLEIPHRSDPGRTPRLEHQLLHYD